MPIENPWPLNISEKVNSSTLLAWFAQFGDEGYLSAEEINKITIALDYLKEITESGGSNLFLGSYTSLVNLEAAHPSPEPGSRATIFVADGDDDLALWDNGDSNWFVIAGAGGVSDKEDKASGVVAYGTDNYTATVPDVTELVAGYKILCAFENPNTGASTINVNELGVKEIRKEIDVQLVADDLKGARWLMYDGEHFQVASHFGSVGGGGGAETFSILYAPDGQYGEFYSNLNVLNQFKTQNGYAFQNSFQVVNSSSTNVEGNSGVVVPYDCKLFKAYIRIMYQDGGTKRDLQVITQRQDTSSDVGYYEQVNQVNLINCRVNEGISGYANGERTVNELTIINPDYVITERSVIKHMVAAKGHPGNYAIQIQYFFKKV